MNKKSIILLILILLLVAGGVFWRWENQLKKQEQKTEEPKTYSEVFEKPIDPKLEPKRHKEIYEGIQEMVGFPMKYPIELPEGYKLEKVHSGGKSKEDPISGFVDVGGFTAIYKGLNGDFTLTEGTGDLGGLGPGEQIILTNNDVAYFWVYRGKEGMTNLLWFGGSSEYPYRISSITLKKEELVQIAEFILSK